MYVYEYEEPNFLILALVERQGGEKLSAVDASPNVLCPFP
jgi:hypothetical protein